MTVDGVGMMSIGLAAAATTLPTTLPAVPPVDPTDGPPWLLAALVGWAVIGLVAARGLGAFRKPGISGPERLAPWDSAWPLLAIAGGAIIALVAGTLVANFGVATLIGIAGAHPSQDVRTLAIGALAEAIAIVAVVAMVREFWPDRHQGLRLIGLRPRGIPNALAGGTAALFILYPLIGLTGSAVVKLYRWLHLTQAKPHPVLEMLRDDHHPLMAVVAVLTASVVAPIGEELMFRGLLQTALGRLSNWFADRLGVRSRFPLVATVVTETLTQPPTDDPIPLHYAPGLPVEGMVSPLRPVARWSAVVMTSIAFAAVHGEPAFFAPLFVLSVGLGFVYERSGNLYMNIVTHSLFNSAQIVIFLFVGG